MKTEKINRVVTERKGYGHWRVTLELNDSKISGITTNSQAIDNGDDLTLAEEICRKNETNESGEFIEYDYSEIKSQMESTTKYVIGKSGRDYEALYEGSHEDCTSFIKEYDGYHEDLTITDHLEWMTKIESSDY